MAGALNTRRLSLGQPIDGRILKRGVDTRLRPESEQAFERADVGRIGVDRGLSLTGHGSPSDKSVEGFNAALGVGAKEDGDE